MAHRVALSMPGGPPPRLILPFRVPRPACARHLRATSLLRAALLLAACTGAARPVLAQGYEWTVESVPSRANLRAIWGSSPSEVFAVGDSGTVLRFDGSSWTKMAFPFGNVSLIDVHGSSASDVYAVGGGQLYRYDGAAWSAFVPQPGAPGPLTVWSISPSEIICAGNGFMKHWDGTQWNQKATFYGFGRMTDIWGVPGGDLFAVDDQGGGLYRYYECQPGYRAWEQVDRETSDLRSLWGSGPSDVWAVGGTLNSVHYTGASNTMCRQPWAYSGPAGWLNGVWGRAANDIWVVGHYAGLGINSYITHFDGNAWRLSPAPEGPGGPTGPTRLQAVWGDRSGDFWVVGDRGHVLRNQPSTPDTTLVVNSTGCGNDAAPGDDRCDTGLMTPEGEPECTLCAAIQEANADAAHDRIEFDIATSDPGYRPATGSFEIAPPLLPTVSFPVTIDGTTQPGTPGRPRIDLRPGGSVGLWIRGGASTVRGLTIRGVQGTGLVIDTEGGNTVTGCHIGTDVTGLVAAGNQRGISISHSADNTIGGLSAYEGNVIAGNSSIGIVVTGTGSTGNHIVGNTIGLAAGGDQAMPNGFHGILVDQGASGTVIGGADPAARNLISSNLDHGIAVAGAEDTRIIGNTIGLDRTGRIARGNGKGGIIIEGAAKNSTVGGTGPGDGNLIAGNLGHGVDLHAITGVAIHRNHVGLDVDGTNRLPNAGDGIRAEDATGLRVGDGGKQSGNMIAANTGAGLRFKGAATRDVVVQHNRIGYLLSPDTSKAANDGGAIRIEAGVESVSIGGTDLDEYNRIYGSVTAVGATTRRISFIGNHLAMPSSVLEGPAGLLPFDLGGDGPSCHCWGGTAGRTNDGVAAPRLLKLTQGRVEGMTSPGATVFAYRVLGAGSGRMRHFFHALEPQGHAVADAEGRFTIPVALAAGDQVVAAATDADGNTSEMSQLKRPIVFVHGIGGAWLQANDGTSLWLPAGTHEAVQNINLRRMSFNEDGSSQEPVTATEMLESVLGFRTVYGPIMDWLDSHGYRGESRNLGGLEMDAWRYWYDWRRSPADAVAGLKALIERVTVDDPGIARSCEVDLVAHSNGGVVSNVYIRGEPEHSRCRVHRYITMGIPVLGTPLAAGAHTRGYIFELEKSLIYGWPTFAGGFLVRWGWMVGMARNLPAGYALMPGEAFWSANRGNWPNHYLEDLNGTPLTSHQETLEFMSAPKVDVAGSPLGLDRNLAMWNRELQQVHARADDWSDFRGPPQVFRIVGRLPNSAIQRWTVFGDPPSRLRYALVTETFSRYEAGDTYEHWSYRERLTPVLGAGDGTVLLSSATLGREPAGGTDLSGVGRSPWIDDFRYFPCKHNDLLIPKCTDYTIQCLQHLTDVLDAGYRVPPAPEAARVAEFAGAAGPGATGPGEILYVRGSEPVSVRIEDGTGVHSGPSDPAEPDLIVHHLEEVGYWSSSQTACLTYDPVKAYTITISALDAASDVQVLRILSDGAADNRNIYFPRAALSAGGSLRLTLPAGGAPASTPLERDASGDGVFEATVLPAATATSTSTAPAIPLPKPFRLTLTGYRTDTGPRQGTLHLPDVGGPGWSWSISTPPAWLSAVATSGSAPDSLVLSFSAAALAAGVYEDTLSLTLGFGGYTETVPVPVRLTVLETPTLARIALTPDYVVLRPSETQAFTAVGYDQTGDTFGVTPAWEAEGGSITPDGVFTAGAYNGLYFVTARGGGIESEAVVEIVGGAPPVTTPAAFALHQNFPNPFADGTTIAFDLPEPARVWIRLFDLRGRQVATLVDADYGAGRHQQALGTLPLTGGVYFYRAEMGSYTATRKMLVVR